MKKGCLDERSKSSEHFKVFLEGCHTGTTQRQKKCKDEQNYFFQGLTISDGIIPASPELILIKQALKVRKGKILDLHKLFKITNANAKEPRMLSDEQLRIGRVQSWLANSTQIQWEKNILNLAKIDPSWAN